MKGNSKKKNTKRDIQAATQNRMEMEIISPNIAPINEDREDVLEHHSRNRLIGGNEIDDGSEFLGCSCCRKVYPNKEMVTKHYNRTHCAYVKDQDQNPTISKIYRNESCCKCGKTQTYNAAPKSYPHNFCKSCLDKLIKKKKSDLFAGFEYWLECDLCSSSHELTTNEGLLFEWISGTISMEEFMTAEGLK